MESNKAEFEIIWTITAYKSFDLNIEFIKLKWNDFIVKRFITKTDAIIENLKFNPSIYPKSINFPHYHYAVIYKNVNLFFRLDNKIIYVILFWDNRQNPKFNKQMNLYGASGHAKVIIDILKRMGVSVHIIMDDNININKILGFDVIHKISDELIKEDFVISVGNNKTRKLICKRLQANFGKAIHPKAIIDTTVEIEEGTVIMAGAVINASTKIGKHCIINTSSTVDHDCILQDYVHISPNATICGGITIGEGSHIGAGAIIIPNLKIGKWCTIGAGAVIISDIPDGVTVVGNPGRIV